MINTIDKFRGCLLGGAVGDTLGYPVEFLSRENILKQYGSRGITEYELCGGLARISDDTQMTLFTADGIFRAIASHGRLFSDADVLDAIWSAYLDWVSMQYEGTDSAKEKYHTVLADYQAMYERRAPGSTCMSTLANNMRGSISCPANERKGCGGIMRVAPIGLYFSCKSYPVDTAAILGAESSALTHGHDLGYIPSAMLADIIASLIRADISLSDAVSSARDNTKEMFASSPYIGQFCDLIDFAAELAAADKPDADCIKLLGEGWVAEETLAISIYCALKYSGNIEASLIAAVNHSGDSDSTGAVTGNILGAYLGASAIPQKYLESLELRDLLIRAADDLYIARSADSDTLKAIAKKYVI